MGVIVPGNDDDDAGYRGRSGANYQYDLSNPIDQNRYNIDINAQKRDLMNRDPRRGIDRGMGQFGGGILQE